MLSPSMRLRVSGSNICEYWTCSSCASRWWTSWHSAHVSTTYQLYMGLYRNTAGIVFLVCLHYGTFFFQGTCNEICGCCTILWTCSSARTCPEKTRVMCSLAAVGDTIWCHVLIIIINFLFWIEIGKKCSKYERAHPDLRLLGFSAIFVRSSIDKSAGL